MPEIRVRSGDIAIDFDRLVVERGGGSIKLTPKAAGVLRLLLDAGGRTVSRTEILDAVWPGTESSDEVLTQVVTELRRAFGVSAKDGRYIETIPKVGYRWVAPRHGVGSSLFVDRRDALLHAPDGVSARRDAGGPRFPTALLLLGLVGAMGVAVGLATRRAEPAGPGFLRSPKPVTSEPGPDVDPALDSTGTRLAYVHRDGDRAEVRIRTMGESNDRVIAAGRVSAPAWSPDGRTLAFVALDAATCEIRTIAVDAAAPTDPRTVAKDCVDTVAGSVAWTADGRGLLYSRSPRHNESPGDRHAAIFRADVATGETSRVSDAHGRLVTDVHPRVSADGQRVVWLRDGDGPNHLVVLDVARGKVERIDTPFWPYRAAFRGNELVFAAHGTLPNELWRRDAGARLVPIARGDAGPGFALSGDGHIVVHEQPAHADALWRYALDGSAPRAITRSTRPHACPRVSPDGRLLAALSNERGAPSIVVQSIDGSGRRVVADFVPSAAIDLAWSPDSRRIAAIVGSARGKRARVVDLDGRGMPLPRDVAEWSVQQIGFSSDGALLVLVLADGRRELRRVDLDGRFASIADFAIASFAAAPGGSVLLQKPGDGALYRYDPKSLGLAALAVSFAATPPDQWQVSGDRLWSLDARPGSRPRLRVQGFDGAIVEEFAIAMPPVAACRNFDVAGEALYVIRREREEIDLVMRRLD